MVLVGLSLSGMGMPSYAADNIVVDSGTATGATNTVTDDKTARVVGTENSVTGSEDANILGDTNTVEDSNGVNIVGNDNKVTKSYPYDGGTRYEASWILGFLVIIMKFGVAVNNTSSAIIIR